MPSPTTSEARIRRGPRQPTADEMAEVMARVQKLEAENDFGLRLAEIDKKLEALLELTCTVCGPKFAARLHPEREAEVKEVARQVSASRNGHSRS